MVTEIVDAEAWSAIASFVRNPLEAPPTKKNPAVVLRHQPDKQILLLPIKTNALDGVVVP
jgi:hypothetical protein